MAYRKKSESLDLESLKTHDLQVGMEVIVREKVSDSNNHKVEKYRTRTGPIIAINDRMFTVQTEFKPESWLLVDLIGTGRVEVRAAG